MAEHVVILNQAQLEEILSRALDRIRDQLAAVQICDTCRAQLVGALDPPPTVDLTKPTCTCAQIDVGTMVEGPGVKFVRGEPDPGCLVHPDDCCPDCRHPWYAHRRGVCMGCWLARPTGRIACTAARTGKGGG